LVDLFMDSLPSAPVLFRVEVIVGIVSRLIEC